MVWTLALLVVSAADRPAIRNFVDSEIFSRLDRENIPNAAQSSDLEFSRRIHLDLTGRLPTSAQLRAFAADAAPGKRDALIEQLLQASEFTDKWTMWAGDWLQNSTAGIYGGVTATRNQFHLWIRNSIRDGYPLRLMAYDVLTAGKESVTAQTGGFLATAEVNTGPKEDGWDNMLAKTASTFLGMSHYDCLLCHDGARHLDPISLWGSQTRRLEAQQMAAFFTHTFSYPGIDDEAAGLQFYKVAGYEMNTIFGNRPNRTAGPDGDVLAPVYRDGSRPEADPATWRPFFARKVTSDRMFVRNLANRLWKQMFGRALAEPVDALDPARLDPENPPPEPWTLQASHPELLEQLAQYLVETDFDLRSAVRLLARSSAYQLSSSWPDDAGAAWRAEYAPLQARHQPRRIDGEEVWDAIVSTTGVPHAFRVEGIGEPIPWAMQLPDSVEPSNDKPARDFLDAFYRGNRSGVARSVASSLPQSQKLLNDPFVLSRLTVQASPFLRRAASMDSADAIADELYLSFLSRYPSDAERTECRAALSALETREQAVEDLAWALINHVDFLFSY